MGALHIFTDVQTRDVKRGLTLDQRWVSSRQNSPTSGSSFARRAAFLDTFFASALAARRSLIKRDPQPARVLRD